MSFRSSGVTLTGMTSPSVRRRVGWGVQDVLVSIVVRDGPDRNGDEQIWMRVPTPLRTGRLMEVFAIVGSLAEVVKEDDLAKTRPPIVLMMSGSRCVRV